MATLTPAEIVAELDKHIVGQNAAKRAVAVALRNRWRRQQVAEPMRHEITPKNILMIGPTGVGKTEIARRLARLAQAPFIKVEATKFTEVGYVGRDVDTIIRDLTEVAVKQTRELALREVESRALDAAEERVLDALVPGSRPQPASTSPFGFAFGAPPEPAPAVATPDSPTRQKFRKKLREGELDEREIDIELSAPAAPVMAMPGAAGMEELSQQMQALFSQMPGRRASRRLRIAEAMRLITQEEAARLVNEEDIRARAITLVESTGIVFIDEIDKVASRGEHQGADVSRQGVQRDLLPLIEGTSVSTRYGAVRTDHILFIASGAFHLSRPSDLIPELQGRLPIRVEMAPLGVDDFVRILDDTDASLIRQYRALLASDGLDLSFTQAAIRRVAELAFQVNEKTENIGARRLHTLMERLLEDLSFDAGSSGPRSVTIDAADVDERLARVAGTEDLARYIL
ncbi:MAG: ATP-dependent HslUV protease, ATP-binding subunit HslU [Pseudomonadota bacterium]|jgi:ATP-dependent HslUV protease ATP-binding subunit HslU